MPKLLINQKPGPCKKSAKGRRVINYTIPHSPFQKLLETARAKSRLSTRELAARIGTSQSTYWIWTHSPNGFPSPKAFNESHLKGLSKALKLSEKAIKDAIDASRIFYNIGEIPPPMPSVDAFANFIQIIRNDKRVRLNRIYVLNLALNLHASASKKP
jgi:transcriptional regulator with XRE-family HTH domain